MAELYVISDLHLGGASPPGRLCTQDRLLAGLSAHIRDRAQQAGGPVALVLAGDIIDFLIPTDGDGKDQPYLRSPAAAKAIVDQVATDYPQFFLQLSEFLGCQDSELVLLLGNHDLELRFESVWKSLADKLLAPGKPGRLHALRDGDRGFRCTVGPATVWVVHGNEVDDWNRVDYQRLGALVQAAAEPPPTWQANIGTTLVVDIINQIKQKRKYGFLDLLKPEVILVPKILIAADIGVSKLPRWKPFLARLPALVQSKAGTIYKHGRRWVRRRLGHFGTLGSAPAPQGASTERSRKPSDRLPPTAPDLVAQAAHDYRAGRTVLDLVGTEDGELGLIQLAIDRIQGIPQPVALRRALRDWLEGDRTFELTHRDETYELLAERARQDSDPPDYLIAGHTHLCRAIEREDGGFYFNTGTWMQLIRLSPRRLASAERFAPIHKSLIEDRASLEELAKVPGLLWQRPTVVRLQRLGNRTRGELCLVVDKDPAADAARVELDPLGEWPFDVEAP